ncbi:MAG: PIG-L family deacetylase [Acidimicrobiia bacterium]|nr:PIG-L family deacetylase [Acidimicrobiia bacterium]
MRRTIVSFHAHPDDEAITTGGVLARAAAEGHRVVLAVATRGELGEVADGVLRPGEALSERRVVETHRAAEILGVHRVEFLGYRDSGMMGEPTNDAPGSFWSAHVGEAAARLGAILTEESADVLTVYDDRGGYGHPDHIQVHRVGIAAAETAGTPPVVFEAVVNRDHIRRLMARAPAALPEGTEVPDVDEMGLGVPESVITTAVDVRDFVGLKRAAMAAHASQIDHSSFFLALPEDPFREAFGWEWFVRRGARPGGRPETWLFDGG